MRKPPSRSAPRRFKPFSVSLFPTSAGACFTACCCAMPAPWANSGRFPWYPGISAVIPTPCRCMSKFCTMSTTSPPPSRSHRFLPCWRCSLLLRRACSNGSSPVAATGPFMSIDAIDLTKRFDDFVALKSVGLSVAQGELLALLGPSGSGKTTLLRIISGLDFPDTGEVSFDGENALAQGASERHVGFVFQHYALFRHMTVFENVAFGLRVQPRAIRKDEATIRARVKELLDLVQLDWLANRYPSQLSGGQRQRIALARALAIEPRILLLDEPFGALDAKVRKELRQWLRSLHHEINVTSIFVTHDQEEALEVANRVVVMDKGRIEQIGTPGDVYDNPATAFVHGFIGESIVLPVHVSDGCVRLDGKALNIG